MSYLSCHLVCVSKGDSQTDYLLAAATNKLLAAGGIEVFPIQLKGKADQALCEYQANHNIDLTIMGAFSHTRIHDLLLGSFTARMLLNTHKPLLLLR